MYLDLVGSYASSTYMDNAYGVAVLDDYAYVVAPVSDSLAIIDVTDKSNPSYVGSYMSSTYINGAVGIAVLDDYAYVICANSNSLAIIDITDKSNPSYVGSYKNLTYINSPTGIAVLDDYAYVIGNISNSLAIIDITDKSNPSYVGSYKNLTYINNASGIEVVGDYAYVIGLGSNSLTIIDITDKSNPSYAGSYAISQPVGVAILDDYAYVIGVNSDSLEIIDITDKSNPIYAGSYASSTYIENPTKVAVLGDYAYITLEYSDSLARIDITDKSNPSYVDKYTSWTYINGAYGITVVDDYAYVTGVNSDSLAIIATKPSTTLDRTYILTKKEAEIQLTAITVPEGLEISWESSNIRIADVDDNGLVTTYKNGTVTITASIEGASAECIIEIGGVMGEQATGLYNAYATNAAGTKKFLGETPQDGAFVFSMADGTQFFYTKNSGDIPTEARVMVGPAILTLDLILEVGAEQFLSSSIYAESATKSILGMDNGCVKKNFEILLHPKCLNDADVSRDITIYKTVVDVPKEITATIDGKKLLKCIFTGLNKEYTLPTPADLTLTAGTGDANVLYWKAVATNYTGISDFSSELSTTVDDDKINFVLPVGAKGLTLYAGEATGPATNIKSWVVTADEIEAGFVDAVGTLYDGGTMTAVTALPDEVTGYYMKSAAYGG